MVIMSDPETASPFLTFLASAKSVSPGVNIIKIWPTWKTTFTTKASRDTVWTVLKIVETVAVGFIALSGISMVIESFVKHSKIFRCISYAVLGFTSFTSLAMSIMYGIALVNRFMDKYAKKKKFVALFGRTRIIWGIIFTFMYLIVFIHVIHMIFVVYGKLTSYELRKKRHQKENKNC
eukprot:785882_1